MKKRLSAICLALAFSMSAMPFAQAASPLKAAIEAKLGTGITEQTIEVPTDISVKKNGDADYINGPVTVTTSDVSDIKADFKADIDMTLVKNAVATYKAGAQLVVGADTALQAELDNAVAKGQFIITITYPATNFEIPADVLNGKNMLGFTTEAGKDLTKIFEEKQARVSEDGKLTITVDVKEDDATTTDVNEGVTLAVLEKALADLTLECVGVQLKDYGTYTVKGEVSGYTTIESTNGEIGKVTYTFVQKDGEANSDRYRDPADAISGTVIVNKPSTGGGSLGGTVKNYTITVKFDDETGTATYTYKDGTLVNTKDLDLPIKQGYKAELYTDDAYTQPVDAQITVDKDIVLYAKWVEGTQTPVEPPLDSEEHFAYVIGYPVEDGKEEVRPENNITREEIATIYYRLLKDDVRDQLFSTKNDFTDVDADRWSNKAISTMANGGYILGYPDGSFQPSDDITRAEFVTICARFYDVDPDAVVIDEADFADVNGHWASAYIHYAVVNNWLEGYDDGTFRPEQPITRAEVMKIINNMLNRHVNAEGLCEGVKEWVDNQPGAWYYYDVLEATNPHTYEREDAAVYETWTGIVENKVIIEKPEYEDAE